MLYSPPFLNGSRQSCSVGSSPAGGDAILKESPRLSQYRIFQISFYMKGKICSVASSPAGDDAILKYSISLQLQLNFQRIVRLGEPMLHSLPLFKICNLRLSPEYMLYLEKCCIFLKCQLN